MRRCDVFLAKLRLSLQETNHHLLISITPGDTDAMCFLAKLKAQPVPATRTAGQRRLVLRCA